MTKQLKEILPHGMNAKEFAEFKRIKSLSDVKTIKKATSDWIRSAKSTKAKQRRMNMSRAIRGAYS